MFKFKYFYSELFQQYWQVKSIRELSNPRTFKRENENWLKAAGIKEHIRLILPHTYVAHMICDISNQQYSIHISKHMNEVF